MTVEAHQETLPTSSEDADRSRAQATAARRRRHRAGAIILIRLASLTIVLAAWQWFGAEINPALFTTPSAVAHAAVGMIASGDRTRPRRPGWRRARPPARAVLGDRRRVRRLHHVPLLDSDRRPGATDRVV